MEVPYVVRRGWVGLQYESKASTICPFLIRRDASPSESFEGIARAPVHCVFSQGYSRSLSYLVWRPLRFGSNQEFCLNADFDPAAVGSTSLQRHFRPWRPLCYWPAARYRNLSSLRTSDSLLSKDTALRSL